MKFISLALIASVILTGPSYAEDKSDQEIDAYLQQNHKSLVLLEEGSLVLAPSISTSMSGQDFGFASTSTTENVISVAAAYGFSKRTQLVANVPVGQVRNETSFLDETDEQVGRTGIMSVGIRHTLLYETGSLPEVVGAVTFGYPISDIPGAEPNIRAGISVYQLLDPVLVSATAGLSTGTETGAEQYDLSGSIDVALTHRFSMGLEAAWVSNKSQFGDPLNVGMTVTASAGISSPSGTSALSPYIAIGVTDQAPDATVGIRWVRTWAR